MHRRRAGPAVRRGQLNIVGTSFVNSFGVLNFLLQFFIVEISQGAGVAAGGNRLCGYIYSGRGADCSRSSDLQFGRQGLGLQAKKLVGAAIPHLLPDFYTGSFSRRNIQFQHLLAV